MAANTYSLTTNFNVDPYYDDFDEAKNFHRVLFRPGQAVQARELTQLQTMLQNQIDRFGEHVFREGSIVSGAELNYDTNYTFVKLRDSDSTGTNVVANTFIGTQVTGSTSNVVAVVVGSATGSEAETPDLKTLYVKYINAGGAGAAGNSYFTLGEELTSNTGALSANVASGTSSVGVGSNLSVNTGIIFAKDHFIRIPAQSITIGQYSSNVSFKVGFDLAETIVSSETDSTLLDPAQGAYNFAAPGANRLKLTGILNKYSLTANTGQNFVEIIRIENGIVQSKADKPQYAAIRDFVARRTRDINGDFIVNGLNVRLREHLNQSNNYGVFTSGNGGDSTKLVVDVEPGKCFVGGYDIENIVTAHVPINKALDFESVEAITTTSNYGNYVTVKEVAGAWPVNNHRQVTLFDGRVNAISNNTYSTAATAGTQIGTARARAIEYSSGTKGSAEAQYKLYLYDVQMSSNTFSEVKSIFIDNSTLSQANGFADTASSSASLSEIDFNRSIFRLPANNTKRLRDSNGNIDTNFQFVKKFDVTIATDGTFTLATGAVDETFPFSLGALNTSQKQAGFYVVLNANTVSSTSIATGSVTAGANTITGVTAASTKFNVGDRIRVENMSNTLIVTSVESTTLTTLSGAPVAASSNNIFKVFSEGQVIDMSGVGGDGASRSVSVLSTTSASFDTQEPLDNTVSATVITDLTKVDGREIAKAYRSNRYVKINANTAVNTTSGPWDLGFSDVHKIIEVRKHTANIISSTDGVDVTADFDLDNGQTDNLYKHASLKKKATSSLSIGADDQILVKLNYFNHDTSQGIGYFSVDSYPIDDSNAANTSAITTQEIPIYTSVVDGSSYWLRDTIDIRPRITDTSSDATTIAGATVNPAVSTTITSPAGGLRYMAPNESLTADLDYYLSRNDILSISPTGEFRVTSGRSAINPLYPEEPSGHLPLAKISIPPYPSISPDVGRIYSRPDLAGTITPVRTEGFTMKEIGQIKSRVDEIEYRSALSYLEATAKSIFLSNGAGADRFKNGIIADSFTGHNIGNVYNADYKAAIDRTKGEMRPQFRLENAGLEYSSANSSNIIITPRDAVVTVGGTDTFTVGETVTAGAASGSLVYQVGRKLYLENVSGTFAVSATATGGSSTSSGTISATSVPTDGKLATIVYSHDKVIEQPFATTTRNAAGLFWSFLGQITLSPDNDYWLDTTTSPDVQINFESNFDNWTSLSNSWQTEWNNWQTSWTGQTVSNTGRTQQVGTRVEGGNIFGLFGQEIIANTFEQQQRVGVRSTIVPETTTRRIGPRVIDTNLIPFVRSRVISVSGAGFKPNTRLYSFFDGVDVSAYITPTNSSFVASSAEGSALVTDATGNVYCSLRIPNDDSLRFRVGDRKFRFTDNSTNASGVGLVTTSGEATYSAQGLTQTVQDTIISTRIPTLVQQTVTESRTLDTGTRALGFENITERFLGTIAPPIVDPIAQTFRVGDYTDLTNSSGSFLTKIDLFFATKDDVRSVFVEIREVDPTTSLVTNRVVPFSTVELQASDINVSSNGGSPTPVTFATPIYLVKNRDYAIVIKPGASNPNTSLFIARLGDNDLISNQRVSKQPNVGVLFASANDRTWTPIQEEDLKFNVYIASFDTSLTGTVVFKNEDVDYLKITGTNTFNTVGESIHGPTTLVATSALSVNADFVLVGNTSTANASVVSQSSNTIIVNDVSLTNKFQVGERVNVVINGVKQEPHAVIHSSTTPTGTVLLFDTVNSTGNTHLHIENVTNTFAAGNQIKGQTSGSTAVVDSVDKIEADILNLSSSYLSFEQTSIAPTARLNTSASARDTVFRSIEDNENTLFKLPKYILSKSLEESNISGEKSGEFRFTLSTTNNRLAPVVDLERANAIVVNNKINNDSTNETSASGGSADAKYITRTLALADGQDAEDIVVRLSAYKPRETELEVYYKILNGADGEGFNSKPWVNMTQSTVTTVYSDSENPEDFITYNYGIPTANKTGGSGEVQYADDNGVTYTGFKYFAIKVVMKSTSESVVPRVKDLIATALQV